MIKAIVYAILQFFLDACVSLGHAYSRRSKDKTNNATDIDRLNKSKTLEEQQNATDNIARSFRK